jgi:hypothetical protein
MLQALNIQVNVIWVLFNHHFEHVCLTKGSALFLSTLTFSFMQKNSEHVCKNAISPVAGVNECDTAQCPYLLPPLFTTFFMLFIWRSNFEWVLQHMRRFITLKHN